MQTPVIASATDFRIPPRRYTMGYLFISIALLCGVTKGFCGKKTSGNLVNTSDAMMVNTVRMLACIFIGFAIIAFQGEIYSLAASPKFILIAALSGIGTTVFTVSWLLSVKQGAYMMVDVFLLMGVVLPITLSKFIYGESIETIQWIGILLLIIAGYVMCSYNASIKGKLTPRALILLALCALSNGVTDFSQKMFTKEIPEGNVAAFNLYTYLFAGITLAVCCLCFRFSEKKSTELQPPIKVIRPIVGYIAVMAVCLFLNSYFKTLAAQHLDAALIYPLSQGGSVILSMAMSAIFFKEKINLRCIIGVALSFVALLLINLLPLYV